MKKFVLLFCFSLVSASAFPCSCIYFKTFCETMHTQSKVARVKILNSYFDATDTQTHFIDVAVVENLQGEAPGDTLTILTGTGTSCDPFPESFIIGEDLIVIIGEAIANNISPWYSFSFNAGCRAPYLFLTNNTVTGAIRQGIVTQPYEALKKNIGECAKLEFKVDPELIKTLVNLAPNPAGTETWVYNNYSKQFYLSMYSTSGVAVQERIFIQNNTHKINLDNYAPGVYFVRLEIEDQVVLKKLVKK